jgi:hypothetical protein
VSLLDVVVEDDKPDKKRYTGSLGWDLNLGLTTPHSGKCFVEKLLKLETERKFWKRLRSTKICNAGRRRRRRRRRRRK